ncbi:hypothetical protein PV328_001023 [Microctonus aethiopoides]|uniref:Uncharacterized protein n=1 Tax=Microctonus aethiopoides TaxID=144406 RepID=A0AA39FW29_9HYME|nr:hypothetical protein PV328_001023 [Microctonus aethiopoides]
MKTAYDSLKQTFSSNSWETLAERADLFAGEQSSTSQCRTHESQSSTFFEEGISTQKKKRSTEYVLMIGVTNGDFQETSSSPIAINLVILSKFFVNIPLLIRTYLVRPLKHSLIAFIPESFMNISIKNSTSTSATQPMRQDILRSSSDYQSYAYFGRVKYVRINSGILTKIFDNITRLITISDGEVSWKYQSITPIINMYSAINIDN